MNSFRYPEDEEQFLTIENTEQLRNLLKLQHTKLSFKLQYFQLTNVRGIYIYAVCKRCDAKLKYRRQGSNGAYKLFSFKNIHNHPLRREENKIVENYIKHLPEAMPVSSMLALTKKAFNISRAKFYYLHRKIWHQQLTFPELVSQLDSQRFESRYYPFPLAEGQIPDTFVTSSQSMIDNFKKFGQFMSFDITYNLIKEVKEIAGQKPKKWGLGLFLGKNNHNRTIPFGFCLMNTETKIEFKDLFRSFFDIMNAQPQAIITDQQIAILGALEELKAERAWSGSHLLDTFHILKNLRKKISNKKVFNALHDAMFEKSKNGFEKLVSLAKNLSGKQEEVEAIQGFLKLSKMYCISQSPPAFHGISLSTSFHEKTNDLLKTYMSFERPIVYVVRKTIKILEELQAKSKSCSLFKFPIQDYVGKYTLKLLRFSTSSVIFSEIAKNYCDSLPLDYLNHGDGWIFRQNDFIETVQIEGSKLICSCGYLQKTGIPCSHLHKVIELSRDDILLYVHDRWKITKGLTQPDDNSGFKIKTKLGRPKNSRKNLY